MPPTGSGLTIGVLEPHLRRYGGIRRMVEFANRLVDRGHTVVFYLPDGAEMSCTWMPCRAKVKPMRSGFDDALDVLIFNHEPQWHLLDHFTNARRRVFYALHYGRLYDKEGSWESLRAPVDLQLANSAWTATQIEAETGHRPTVVLGGVNRETFHPYDTARKVKLLCSGDARRPWKGTDTIEAAARIAGVPLEGYSGKDLSQAALGRAYASARVFAVGSWFEGFCQPGLEALACGTPLVTTDNGGCLEYAFDEETALVVPPREPEAMAEAITRLLSDRALSSRLSNAGLALVDREFNWEQRTDAFEELLDGLSAGMATVPVPVAPEPPADPILSVVTLQWNGLVDTQQFVESVRRNTDVPYELIIVDNGSEWEAAAYAEAAADVSTLNPTNQGFAKGMNQGLALAKGEYVAFCNNDTFMPEGWASTLIETARAHPQAGIVVPAVTAARNPSTVRTEPGTEVEVLAPFCAPPAAVIYVMPTATIKDLGTWGEEYEIASGEDVDLAFKVWVNDLDIVYDQRVLVEHEGKGAASRLPDWRALWEQNRRLFLDKWSGDAEVPRLASVDADRFARNRATARAAAEWMDRFFSARSASSTTLFGGSPSADGDRAIDRLRPAWKAVKPLLPRQAAEKASARVKVRLRGGGATARAAASVTNQVADSGDRLKELKPAHESGTAYLAQGTGDTVYLVDGDLRRRVTSGLLSAALEEEFGRPRRCTDADLTALGEGPPVEILSVSGGAPFVILSGRRRPIHGLPATSAVGSHQIERFAPGDVVDLAKANVSRARFEELRWRRNPVVRLFRKAKRTLTTSDPSRSS